MAGRGGGENGTREPREPAGGGPWVELVSAAVASLPVVARVDIISLGEAWADLHADRSHELVHVLAGRARIELGAGPGSAAVPVGPGDTLLIPADTPHRDVKSADHAYRVLYVFFRWPGAGDALLRSIPAGMLAAAPAPVKARLRSTVLEIEEEYLRGGPDGDGRIRVMLLELLLSMARHAHGASRPPPDRAQRRATDRRRAVLAEEVHRHLAQHYAKPIGLDALAQQFGVSPFHLCRTFARHFGASISDVLASARLDAARDLLRDHRLSVKEVAARSGFADANYFAKVFRRACGLSPSEFRSLVLKAGHDPDRPRTPMR